ncbi:hypothetical protein [Amycolatopsis sp. NPDC059021]|uniref:protein kinase domain-containing protein n=1 Tax=Amycolatopsis sp. NPDC059021 TaxID=3346704 RepID=UPI00366E96BD
MAGASVRADYGEALPAGFSILEELDDDAVATTYLIGGPEEREAVLTVGKSPVPDETRAEFTAWAAKLALAAEDPRVADVLGSGITGDSRPFLIAGTGEVLADRLLTDGSLPPRDAVRHGVTLAEALAAAHEAGVVHGTVQPSAVLVVDGDVVLTGFDAAAPGLAVPAEPDLYTPPECIAAAVAGTAQPSEAGDVYGLAVTTYVALGGTPPWHDASLDLRARTAPLPESPAVPPELLTLLQAGVAVDPGHRPTAAQAAEWFSAFALSEEDGQGGGAVGPDLLAGRGRRVGPRTAALIVGGVAAAGTTTGLLASGSASVAPAGAPTAIASAPGVVGAPAASSAAAAPTTAVSGGVSVVKVAVAGVVVAAAATGAGLVVPRLLAHEPCDTVVGDRQAIRVLADAAGELGRISHRFTTRIADRTYEGAVDPVTATTWFTRRQDGLDAPTEFRSVGGTRYAFTGTTGTWGPSTETDVPSPTPALAAAASATRRGCEFEGVLDAQALRPPAAAPVPFTARIDESGHLVLFTTTPPSAVHQTFSDFGTRVDVPSPSVSTTPASTTSTTPAPTPTPPTTTKQTKPPTTISTVPRPTLYAYWISGARSLIINDPADVRHGPNVSFHEDTKDPVATCFATTSGDPAVALRLEATGCEALKTVSATVTLTGKNQLTVTGDPVIAGIYQRQPPK